MTDRLAKEHAAVNINPLNESLGESYHCQIRQAAQRCSAAQEPYILGSVCHNQNLDASSNFDNQGPPKNRFGSLSGIILNGVLTFCETAMNAMQNDRPLFAIHLYRLNHQYDDWNALLGHPHIHGS